MNKNGLMLGFIFILFIKMTHGNPGDKCYVNGKEMRRDKFNNCSVVCTFGERFNKRTFKCEDCIHESNDFEQHFYPHCVW